MLVLFGFAGNSQLFAHTGSGGVQEAAANSPLRIHGIEVVAANSGTIKAETLCRLTVLLENTANQPAFSLAFEVEIGGEKLPVYEKQLFMVPVPPNAGQEPFELDLFNFWTSDSKRAVPANGKLEIKVSLVEAQWLEVSETSVEGQQESSEAVETWTPKGPVAGLPSVHATTITLGK